MHELLSVIGLQEYAGLALSVLHVMLIVVLSLILLRVANRFIRVFRLYMSSRVDSAEEAKRLETLGRVFRYIASVVITVVSGMLILSEFGISIAPILATAGVVGIAIGFGAQSLVKDYFNGFFLLLENQIRQGDVIEVDGKAGLVEEVTLRYVRLRDYQSNVHFIPNGQITTVTCMSREFSHAVVNIGIGYQEDVDTALAVMREVGAGMCADPVFKEKILDEIEIAGVDKWDDSAVVLLCRFKVKPLEQWGVRREFLRRLKYAFDQRGIEIPYPHLTVFQGKVKNQENNQQENYSS